jgi:hypothetical protein
MSVAGVPSMIALGANSPSARAEAAAAAVAAAAGVAGATEAAAAPAAGGPLTPDQVASVIRQQLMQVAHSPVFSLAPKITTIDERIYAKLTTGTFICMFSPLCKVHCIIFACCLLDAGVQVEKFNGLIWQTRWLWASQSLDRIVWGSELGFAKGFELTSSISFVSEGND